ncbi:TetR/AcrR family transcriptional regulator [Kineosporia succinea]|uniref:AcrR family transcriptional regulator n=1 Tax=Kineosporia succinea TaxID=84632 RepID=A0ABT9P902_9ACTN|nr:TetR family transcriptional regulator [Kineosporia succinea]MDP9828932.1 AcrR family transcriptional regulator [Kineosporia succinea]
MARPKDQRERRHDLVRAAMRAITAHGAAGLKIRDVAAEAGLSPALVSYYYPRLDDLLLDVHAHVVQRFYTARRAAIETLDDPVAQLRELARRGVPGHDEISPVIYEMHLHAARNRPHAALMTSLWEQEVSLYERVLSRGEASGVFTLRAPARTVAETVVALEDAVGLHLAGHNAALPAEHARDLVAGLLERETGQHF